MQINKHINPFINNLNVPYIEVVTNSRMVLADTKVYGYKVEAMQHFRTYTSVKIREFLYRELSSYARDMFGMIQHFTNSAYRYVILTHAKVEELIAGKYSKRRYEDTVRELISKGILEYKDKAQGEYWYNPYYFAPGNRITMFEECLVKVKTVHAYQKEL